MRAVRATFLVILPRILMGAIYNIVLFFFMFSFFAFGTVGIGAFVGLFILGMWYVGKKVFYWRRNAFIITTQRIVDVEQKGWLNKQISEISHYKIDNISHRIRGIFHALFRCGDIFVHSRGGTTNLIMKDVYQPAKVQSFLQKILEEAEEKW